MLVNNAGALGQEAAESGEVAGDRLDQVKRRTNPETLHTTR